MRSKGLELPTTTLIILIVAVIVLLAVAALFISGWGGSKELTLEKQINELCHKWILSGCSDSASTALTDLIGSTDESTVRNRCGCPTV